MEHDELRDRLGGNTPKSSHTLKGRRFDPPVVATGNLQPADWERDRLPDLLWISSVAGITGNPGDVLTVLEAVDSATPGDVATDIDGLISSFGLVPPEHRDAVRDAIVASNPETLDGFVADVLLLFPDGPAHWLVDGRSPVNDPADVIEFLRQLVVFNLDGRSALVTRTRATLLARRVQHGRLKLHAPTLEVLVDVANGTEEEEHASIIRATHSAAVLDRDGGDWQRHFWRTCYDLTECRLDDDHENLSGRLTPPEGLLELSDRLCTAVDAVGDTLRELRAGIAIDAYDPIPDEVKLGLASRAFRLARTLVADPASWRADRVSELSRQLLEVQIMAAWLVRQPAQVLHDYKEYGLGRIKLWKLNIEEQIESHVENDTEPDEMLFALHGMLREEVNAGLSEEFLGVDLGANATGLNLRKMADDVGLSNVYKLGYGPLSGSAHGDWYSLQGGDLVRCMEPLHRLHLMPRLAVKRRPYLENMAVGGLHAADETIQCVFSQYGVEPPRLLESARPIIEAAVIEQRARNADAETTQTSGDAPG